MYLITSTAVQFFLYSLEPHRICIILITILHRVTEKDYRGGFHRTNAMSSVLADRRAMPLGSRQPSWSVRRPITALRWWRRQACLRERVDSALRTPATADGRLTRPNRCASRRHTRLPCVPYLNLPKSLSSSDVLCEYCLVLYCCRISNNVSNSICKYMNTVKPK